ncbi:MAG: metal-dependent hydrolase [Anaerolineae bacterium]|nr:metal-dependent hydrolase [Caldilineales bacterium]MDW8270408.1 metal-dependent hydrolase [Anaerolineae bacterium]
MSVSVVYHGHACFSVVADGKHILIDPFLTGNPLAKIGPDEVQADFILISHGHGDHVGDAVAIAKRTGALVICNYEILNWLDKQGVKNVHPLHIGGGNRFPFGRCKMTIAHHGSGLPDGSYGGNPGGFLLKLNAGKTIYFSGDTALTYDMKWLADDNVDVAILCIGDNFTMGPDDAIKAVKLIEPKTVIPCHFGTWPYIEVDAEDFQARCHAETSARCVLLHPEESFDLA